jgi:hypothetical protein
MRILVPIAQRRDRLSRAFQIMLNASMQCAAEVMRQRTIPLLYSTAVQYRSEPWAGQGLEEFADPYTVLARGWGDCDDLVIYRGAELLARGIPCHARILHDTTDDKYHTQLTRDRDGIIEDPCLQRLGRPYLWRARS